MNEKEYRLELIKKYMDIRNKLALEYKEAINKEDRQKEEELWKLITDINNLIMAESSHFAYHEQRPISEDEINHTDHLNIIKHK